MKATGRCIRELETSACKAKLAIGRLSPETTLEHAGAHFRCMVLIIKTSLKNASIKKK
jgi:hypothetical protein